MTVFLMRRKLERHIKKEDHVETEKTTINNATREMIKRKQDCQHINLRCVASRTVSKYILLF